MNIVFVDHYDSFSQNVVQLLRSLEGVESVHCIFYDKINDLNGLSHSQDPIVFGPGPHGPVDVLNSVNFFKLSLDKVPMFGICLGMQIFAFALAAQIKKAVNPWHGKTKRIDLKTDDQLFKGISREIHEPFYNSLAIDLKTHDSRCHPIAIDEDGDIAAISVKSKRPTYAVQFHPESFMSTQGPKILSNWINLVANR